MAVRARTDRGDLGDLIPDAWVRVRGAQTGDFGSRPVLAVMVAAYIATPTG
jgi:hypothetical protein